MYTLEIKVKCEYDKHRFRDFQEITNAVTTVIKRHIACESVSATLYYENDDEDEE